MLRQKAFGCRLCFAEKVDKVFQQFFTISSKLYDVQNDLLQYPGSPRLKVIMLKPNLDPGGRRACL